MKGTKEVRRIAWALAWADGFDISNAMEPWRWDAYLESAQEIVSLLTASGDQPPAEAT